MHDRFCHLALLVDRQFCVQLRTRFRHWGVGVRASAGAGTPELMEIPKEYKIRLRALSKVPAFKVSWIGRPIIDHLRWNVVRMSKVIQHTIWCPFGPNLLQIS